MNSPTPISNTPKVLVISLVGIKELIEQTFPLISADRDELVRQVFDFYLNNNDLGEFSKWRPRLDLLHIDHYRLSATPNEQHNLMAVAMGIHALVFDQLVKHNFAEMIRVQDGFYYIFDHFLPNGYIAVLRNIA